MMCRVAGKATKVQSIEFLCWIGGNESIFYELLVKHTHE